MKILVVDDKPIHRRSAKKLEELGHAVVLESCYMDVFNRKDLETFDVALIDLMMPAEDYALGQKAMEEHLGKEIPIGYALVFRLAMAFIRRIAVVTDGNHHHDPMVATMDYLQRGIYQVGIGMVIMQYAHLNDDGSKNWEAALKAVLTA